VVDGLKGFAEAIGASYPQTVIQTCIVHLIRASLAYVSWKDPKTVMPDLKEIYRAATAEAALERLDAFESKWSKRYPTIAAAWRGAWDQVVRFSPLRRRSAN
jgi:putative transposase